MTLRLLFQTALVALSVGILTLLAGATAWAQEEDPVGEQTDLVAEELAHTGLELHQAILLALLVLALGATLLEWSRRRDAVLS